MSRLIRNTLFAKRPWINHVLTIICFFVFNYSQGQVVIEDIPDQTVGLGGHFSDINLSGYSTGDPVIWEVGFPTGESSLSVPDWNVTSTDNQFEMNITAVITSKGAAAMGSSHLLAVLDAQGEVRGVANAIEVAGNWVYFMTVYGNTAGTELQFAFYDSNYQEILKGGKIDFNPNAVLGEPDAPYEVSAEILGLTLENDVLSIDLSDSEFLGTEKVVIIATGVDNPSDIQRDTVNFTVISDYEPILDAIPDQVVAFGEAFNSINLTEFTIVEDGDLVSYSATTGENLSVTIEEATSLAIISYPDAWSGTEVVTFTVTDQTTQQFKASRDVSFTVRPEEVAPIVSGLLDQTIGTGGIPESIHLNDYLQTNNPDGIVWSYNVYDENGGGVPSWEVNSSAFELSMTMTCAVRSYGRLAYGANHQLAAFQQSDSLLVGKAEAIEVGDGWYFFLTIYGSTDPENLFFQFYDAEYDKVVDVIETESFVSNAVLGDPLSPVILNAGYIAPKITGDLVEFAMLVDSWSGEEHFIFIATDTTTAGQLSGRDTLKIEVIDIQSPTLSEIPVQEIYEAENFGPLSLEDYLGGVAAEMVTFSIAGADRLNPVLSNNRVNVTVPDDDYYGTSTLLVTAVHNDFPNLSATRNVEYVVNNVNDPPFFNGEDPEISVRVGDLYRYEINGKDIDDTNLELTVSGNPDWLVFVKNGGFGLLFGTPSQTDEGTSLINLELTDGKLTVTKEFELQVIYSYAKLTEAPDQVIAEGGSFAAFDLTSITDKTDDVSVGYSISGGNELAASLLGSELSIDIPNPDWFGSETFRIEILDLNNGSQLLDETSITYSVQNVNDAPVISTALLPNVGIGVSYSQEILITDVDNSDLIYSIDGQPSWVQSAETKNGLLLFGTPSDGDKGEVNLIIEVSDGELTDTKEYVFQVSESYAVLLDGTLVSIKEGETFSDFDLTSITNKTDDFAVAYAVSGGEELTFDFLGSILSLNVPNADWFGSEQVTIQLLDVNNANALLDETVITYEVLNVNDAPIIESTSINDIKVLEELDVLLQVSDIDSEDFSYTLTGSPGWMSIAETRTGLLLYGRPGKQDFGTINISFEVSDGDLTATQNYSFEVLNRYAVLTDIDKQSVYEGESFSTLDLSLYTDITDDFSVSYAISGGNEMKGTLSGTELIVSIPDEDWYGFEVFNVYLIDVNTNEVLDQQAIDYEVIGINDAPEILTTSLPNVGINEIYHQSISVADIDSKTLTYQFVGQPTWLLIDETKSGLILYGTPHDEDKGTVSLTVEVSDGDQIVSKEFTFQVSDSYASLLEPAIQKINEGQSFTALDLTTLTDKTEDYTVNYAVSGGTDLTFDLDGTILNVSVPDENWFGTESFTIQLLDANNSDALLDEEPIIYEVVNVNDAPVIITSTIPDLKVLDPYEEMIEVFDIDSHNLSYSLTGHPAWLKYAATTSGLLVYGTPSKIDFGTINLTVEVSDGELTVSKDFTFEVANSYAKFTSASDQIINEGETFSILKLTEITDQTIDYHLGYSVSAGQELIASITGTDLIIAIPDEDWFGSETFIISLLDSLNDLEILDQTTITYEVINVNDAPEFETTVIAEAGQGVTYSQEIVVSDIDNDLLVYSLINAPDWINGNATNSGILIFGVPEKNDVGNKKLIIEVTDGVATVSKEFTLKVNQKIVLEVDDLKMKVSPNPAIEHIHLNSPNTIFAYSIYSLSGQEIFQEENIGASDYSIDLSNIPNGTYMIRIETSKSIETRKIMIGK